MSGYHIIPMPREGFLVVDDDDIDQFPTTAFLSWAEASEARDTLIREDCEAQAEEMRDHADRAYQRMKDEQP